MSEVKKATAPSNKGEVESPETEARRMQLEQLTMDELRKQFGDSRVSRYHSPDRQDADKEDENLICTLDKTL